MPGKQLGTFSEPVLIMAETLAVQTDSFFGGLPQLSML
jgi:hypothetical protein